MSQADKKKSLLLSKLRNQGAAFRTKGLGGKPAESGTGTGTGPSIQAEGGSETSRSRAVKKKTRDAEVPEEVDVGVTVAELAPVKKKPRTEKAGPASVLGGDAPDTAAVIGSEARDSVPENSSGQVEATGAGTMSPAGENVPDTVMVPGTSTPQAPGKKEIKIGTMTLGELAGMAASIADDKEREKLKGNSLADSYRGRLALWAQEGMLIAADRRLIASAKEEMKQMSQDIAQKDSLIAKAQEEIIDKERQVLLRSQANEQLQRVNKKLQDQLDEFRAQGHTLKEQLKHAGERESDLKDRVKKAEKDAVVQQRRVVELEAELDGRRPEDVVIREYKESDEHLEELMGAAAADLRKCWVITKSLTLDDPNHSYDAFCDAFEGAEDEPEKEILEQEPVPPLSPVPTSSQVQVETPADPAAGQAKDGAEIREQS